MFGQWTIRDRALYAEVEVGMPLTGTANLAETPLLKLLGDIRWRHVAELSGIDSRDLTDEAGARLYATFFYVELAFPRHLPMSSFGENDRFTIVSNVFADEELMLDGLHLLYPMSWPEERLLPVDDIETALTLGVPVARTSNAFVKMVRGPGWLKKGVPANGGMARIPRRPGAEEVYRQVVVVSGGDRSFARPPPTFSPLTDGKVRVQYLPDPDRDLNGVGLLYFANYPAVLDNAERQTLPHVSPIALGDDLLDRRTLVNRKSAFISNIVPPDTIEVLFDAWIENPFLASDTESSARPVRLFLNYQMYRGSDGRKMMVSTAEKVLEGTTLEESGLLPVLARRARVQ